MQLLTTELARARTLRAEATDARAQAALDGVIFALQWAYEDASSASPADRAAALRSLEEAKPKQAKAKKKAG